MLRAAIIVFASSLLHCALVFAAPVTFGTVSIDGPTPTPISSTIARAIPERSKFRLKPISEGGLLADVGHEDDDTSLKISERDKRQNGGGFRNGGGFQHGGGSSPGTCRLGVPCGGSHGPQILTDGADPAGGPTAPNRTDLR